MGKVYADGFADLHIHTLYSDGKLSPEEVVEKAVERNLKAIAITDHDCITGIFPAINAAEETLLEIVPGVEVSAAINDIEIHLLGYFIDYKNPSLVDQFQKMQTRRVERIKEMLCLLAEQGINISWQKILEKSSKGAVGRLHLAQVMVEEGAVRNIKEAFDRYIGDSQSFYVKHKRLDYTKAIEMIMKVGGVPVLAHPGTMGNDEYISSYVQAGLRGIEVFHTKHRSAETKKYLALAEKYNLIATGGSDCHGMGKVRTIMGSAKVGYSVVEELREESEKIRQSDVYGFQ